VDGITSDLEAIVFRALAKEKHRRYQSAEAFAADLERFLRGDAVEAKADSRWYVLRKTVRRYRVPIAVAALFMLMLTGSAVTVTALWFKATHERDNARGIALDFHRLLDVVIGKVDDAVRTLAGGVDVSNDILAELTGTLDSLIVSVENDPALRHTLAKLHEKRGDIAYAQSRRDETKAHYTAFLELADELNRGEPANAQAARARARALRKLARVSYTPEADLNGAVSTLNQIMPVIAGDNDTLFDLCTVQTDLARHLYSIGRHPEAQQQIARVLAAIKMVPLETPGSTWDELHAMALDCAADIQMKFGMYDVATTLVEESLTLRRRLCERSPAHVGWLHDRILAELRLGSLYRDAGRLDDAVGAYESAVSNGEYLVTADKSVTGWAATLCRAYQRFAKLLVETERFKKARVVGDAMLKCALDLNVADPQDMEFTRLLGFARLRYGDIVLHSGDALGARFEYEEALRLCRYISECAPDDFDALSDVAEAHDHLGRCLGQIREYDESLDHYWQAANIRSALFRSQPCVPDRAIDVVTSRRKLATGYLRLNTLQADEIARELLCECGETLLQLQSSDGLAVHGSEIRKWMKEIDANKRLILRREFRRTIGPRMSQVRASAASDAD
jgi:tetratricopeptide (TPR) repeat protein